MSDHRQRQSWFLARAPQWQALNESLKGLQYRRRASVDEALEALDGYQGLARDLATARRSLPGTGVTAALESLYASYHSLINRTPRNSRAGLLRLLRVEIPEIFVSLRAPISWVSLLFVLSIFAGWWLITAYPTLIGLIASEEMIGHVERGELWTKGMLNVAPSSLLSIQIFSNNVVVSFMAFCVGAFYGLGTFYMISLNGLLLGGLFAFTRQHGLDGELLNFVVAHGLVELSIICISGAAGMALGESLIRPVQGTRRESFELCAIRMIKLLGLCAVLLVGSGLIEGFVSPDPAFPLASRLVIGVCYWIVMLAALTGRLFRPHRDAEPIRVADV
jgi:uncharacterized membrane protein SpoIIM required for sporulation